MFARRLTLIFFLFSQGLFSFYAFCQNNKDAPSFIISKAEALIEAGEHGKAALLLKHIRDHDSSKFFECQAKILLARIDHENGAHSQAIDALRKILAGTDLAHPKNITLRVDAYLVMGECFFSMFQMENFKNLSDTVLQLANQYQLKGFYKSRAYTNMVRFYAYHALLATGKPYFDSAMALFHRAHISEIKYYNPISFYTACINFERNYDRSKLNPTIDSAIRMLENGYAREKYSQHYLWRAIGNSYLDIVAAMKYPTLNYRKSFAGFKNAMSILQTCYPSNRTDLTYLYNLFGLLNRNAGMFKKAETYFEESKSLIGKYNFSKDNYAFLYVNTYMWESGILDSIYCGMRLIQKKKDELQLWQDLAPHWQQWQIANQNQFLHFYRDIYAKSPYDNIVRICYDLYQLEKDPKYTDIAFQAQEQNKYYFLKENMKKKYQLVEKPVPTVKDIQNSLPAHKAIISFSDITSYYGSTYMLTITADTVCFQKKQIYILYGSDPAFIYQDSLLKDINSFKKAYFLAYRCYFMSLEPVFGNKIKEITVLPSTQSSRIKFDLLISDTSGLSSFEKLPYLGRKYRFTYDLSYQIADLRNSIKQHPPLNKNAYQAFIPDYYKSPFSSLPFFSKSANTLRSKYGFIVYDKRSATVDNYIKNAGNAAVLHLAGHLSLKETDLIAPDTKMPLDSSENGADIYLTPDKIASTPLNADLTVLSLCETNAADLGLTDGRINFAYWFIYAGSKSCVFSYWKLDDRSTAYIIEKFYDHLQQGMKKSDALFQAKKDYLAQAKTEEEKDPVYWGGLSVIGDDSPIHIRKEQKIRYAYLLLLLIIPIALFSARRIIKLHH